MDESCETLAMRPRNCTLLRNNGLYYRSSPLQRRYNLRTRKLNIITPIFLNIRPITPSYSYIVPVLVRGQTYPIFAYNRSTSVKISTGVCILGPYRFIHVIYTGADYSEDCHRMLIPIIWARFTSKVKSIILMSWTSVQVNYLGFQLNLSPSSY